MPNKIQNIFKCVHYTFNGNMNLTCRNSKRCCIFYEVHCNEYEVVDEGIKDISSGK